MTNNKKPPTQREEFLEFQTTALPLESPLGPSLTDALSVKPIIRTQWRKTPERFKRDPLPSKTVPGQSQKLKKIMDKYKVGIPPLGYRAIYSEDVTKDLGINPKALDYVDIQELSNENLQKINALEKERNEILRKHEETLKLKQEEETKDRLRKEIEEEAKASKP